MRIASITRRLIPAVEHRIFYSFHSYTKLFLSTRRKRAKLIRSAEQGLTVFWKELKCEISYHRS